MYSDERNEMPRTSLNCTTPAEYAYAYKALRIAGLSHTAAAERIAAANGVTASHVFYAVARAN